tara:strand:- start:100 stop:891 length:792 start_codon:yes stop_codon:yes gene_type:complete
MKKFILNLKKLKKLGAIAVKQSLEDEGASFDDIKKMRAITRAANLDLNVKIGGCEAKNDITFCKKIGVNGIVAPMVESQYALNKFIQTSPNNKKNSLYINLESKLAFDNINEIMRSPNFTLLKGVVIGRSDLAGSLGLTKSHVDSNRIYKRVFSVLKKIQKIKKKRLICKMGGSITYKSRNFINKLYEKKLLQRIETRNIEILLNRKNIDNLNKIFIHAFNFEMEWIKYKSKNLKSKNSTSLQKDYSTRIEEIKKRIKIMGKI